MPARTVDRRRPGVLTRAAAVLDRCVSTASLAAGRLLILGLTLLGVVHVLGRALDLSGVAALQDLETWLFFALVMLTFGYTYLRDGHVRVDVFSAGWRARTRAAVELAAIVAGLLPLTVIVAWDGGDAAWRSWLQGERLADDIDLPLQWLVRATMPAGFALLLLAGVAAALRAIDALRSR